MVAPVRSPTLMIALRDVGRTDGEALLKSALKELVAAETYAAETVEEARRLRSPRRRVVLFDGPAAVPADPVLAGVARMVAGAPTQVVDGRVGRDLREVAEHLAKQPKVRERIVEAALAELVTLELVATEERKVLGVVKRKVHVRTPDGNDVNEVNRKRAAGHPDGQTHVHGVYDDHDDAWDSSVGSSFDSSFDSSFGSSFDSGFSGGGDGGGGGGGD